MGLRWRNAKHPVDADIRESHDADPTVDRNELWVFTAAAGRISLVLQVLKPGPNVFDDLKSNTVTFKVFNPGPTVSSRRGMVRANLSCTPTNGFDVRVNGSGFVNNGYNGSTTSTSLTVNGAAANRQFVGSGPVYGQMQLLISGSLIPTAGNYTLQVCHAGTSSGTACATTTLRVDP